MCVCTFLHLVNVNVGFSVLCTLQLVQETESTQDFPVIYLLLLRLEAAKI